MKAFHNSPELKAGLLRELHKHEAADAATRGTYGEMGLSASAFKGCAIGCALNSLNLLNGRFCPTPKSVSDHHRFPEELGIPVEIAYLVDHIFENLPAPHYKTWSRRVIEAVPVGADLSNIVPTLLEWIILDPTDGFISRSEPKFHPTYRRFAGLVRKDWTTSGSVTLSEWGQIEADLVGCRPLVRARAWIWARARARAWTGAWTSSYNKLSEKAIDLLSEAR